MIISTPAQLRTAVLLTVIGTVLAAKAAIDFKYHQSDVVQAVRSQHRARLLDAITKTIGFRSHDGLLLADYCVLGAERNGRSTKAYLLAASNEFVKKQDGTLELVSGTWGPIVAYISPGQLIGIQRPSDGGEFRPTFESMFPWPLRSQCSWQERALQMESRMQATAARQLGVD